MKAIFAIFASCTYVQRYKYAKLGVVYYGVNHEGFIAVGDDPHNIADGGEIFFERRRIKAKRQCGEYKFIKAG